MIGLPNSDGKLKTMNKVRGRIMEPTKQTYPYKVKVDGPQDIYNFEFAQKKIHDNVVDSGATSFSMTSIMPPGLDDQLAIAGVYLSWVHNCSFTNTIVRPLIAMNKHERFSPKGHKFIRENFVRKNACYTGSIFGRTTEDTYSYVFINAWEGSGYRQQEVDAIVAFYWGIHRVLINPWYFLDPPKGAGPPLAQTQKQMSTLSEDQLMRFRYKAYNIV
jgi:hypothetical protein